MILYGVDRVFIQEIDPVTSLPVTGGASYLLKCSETLEFAVAQEDAEESVKKCPSSNAIMGARYIDAAVYGYTITLTENEWNPALFALLNGFETGTTPPDYYTPSIVEGFTFKPFRIIAFSAIYEGSDISGYAMFVFNKCRGTVTDVTLGQDWVQIAYTIEAREATVAGLPLLSIGTYAGSVPPDDITDFTVTSGHAAGKAAGTRANTGETVNITAATIEKKSK